MLNDKNKQLIEATSLELGINRYVIEKDFYVTQAISLATQVEHDAFDLVFQGGTCLAKAHRIIKRMSEDCDFRVRLKSNAPPMSKEAKRKALRSFRRAIVNILNSNGLSIDPAEIRVRNEGQFMSVRASYPSLYPTVAGIKPYLALEFFLNEVKTPTEEKPITTLIHQVLGNIVDHEIYPINSISVIETAAEKWVALTRRVATSTNRNHYRDSSLVRHLYDLYNIERQGLFTDIFYNLVCRIVNVDRQQYKNHNDQYYQNPIGEIRRAVDELRHSETWENYWHQFLAAMVYDEIKPSYQQVLENLEHKTEQALAIMQNNCEIA